VLAKRVKDLVLKYTTSERRDFILQNSLLAGILEGTHAYTGPDLVQIDLTNKCNNSCLGCWIHSPLVGESRSDIKKEELPVRIVKKLIDDLNEMGSRRINISGGGEPLIYPKAMEVLQYLREKEMETNLITSFAAINEEIVKKIIELDLNQVFISVWAATPETYVALHPNKNDLTFHKIKKRIRLMSEKRRDEKTPRIIIINVITNINYQEIEAMIEFAMDVGADKVGFTLVDTIRGKTDSLMLSEREKSELKVKIEELKMNIDGNGYYPNQSGRSVFVLGLNVVEKSISEKALPDEPFKELVDSIPCYAGWLYSRILANGDVIPCCKADKKPMGNIKKNSFKDIWGSNRQHEFRKNAKLKSKDDPYFSDIRCYQRCDNYHENLRFDKRLNSLAAEQINVLIKEIASSKYLKTKYLKNKY
jgi:radical SAM protein with 4Fe4S-binding SPASM domain